MINLSELKYGDTILILYRYGFKQIVLDFVSDHGIMGVGNSGWYSFSEINDVYRIEKVDLE